MLLNEYKRNFFRLLNEGAAEMYRDSYYPEVDDYILEKIIEIDPESNGDDLSDFGKLLLKLNPQMSDFEQLRKDIDIFAKAVRNGAEVPDVKTVEELHYAAVDLANSNAHMTGDEVNAQEESLECPTVYSDGEYRVIDICNKDASQRGKIYVILKGSEKFSVIRMGSRLRITDAQDENVSKDMFPQEMLTVLTGVNESKNVRLSENELMNMLVEAVENKMSQSKKVNEAIIGSPEYFHNILTGSEKDTTVSGGRKGYSSGRKRGRKGYNVYRDFKHKLQLSCVLENYDIEIKNYRIEVTSKYIIECYDCYFTTDMTDYSKEDFIELKENIQNSAISKLNIDNNDFFIRFLNKHLLQIRIKRDKPTDMNESRLKKMISEAVKKSINEIMTGGPLRFSNDIVYGGKDWVIVKPSCWESSCVYGNDTHWCISSKVEDHKRFWDMYSENGEFYFLISKNGNRKYALYFGENGENIFLDATDREIEMPVLSEIGVEEEGVYEYFDSVHHLEDLGDDAGYDSELYENLSSDDVDDYDYDMYVK